MSPKMQLWAGGFAAIVIWFFVGITFYDLYTLPASSMTPTLEPDSQLFARPGNAASTGDIIVFDKPGRTAQRLVSRVIATGGQTISFVDGQVVVDGQQLAEDYIKERGSTRERLTIPGCAQAVPLANSCEVPDGSVFVMGDNRLGSSDSRVYGPVSVSSIHGRAVNAPFWFRIDWIT